MSDDTGGPAFPLSTPEWHEQVSQQGYLDHDFTMGMTLRDYFAAKAIPALLELWHKDLSADDDPGFAGLRLTDNEGGTPDMIAEEAYAIADAMLAAR